MNQKDCIVLYSGGTDSTCAAAIVAQQYSVIHLLTFVEQATKNSPLPKDNTIKLESAFPQVKFFSKTIEIDILLKHVSYDRYFAHLWRWGLFMLFTPGFSSLCWHLHTIVYAKQHGITRVVDGLTKELMHFPGHMDAVVKQFQFLYAAFGIEYTSPVRNWTVPRDQQYLDRLVVDRHGFILNDRGTKILQKTTTGQYLYQLGIFPHQNVKGSKFDQLMQHDCYPFVLYNILFFWVLLPMRGIDYLEFKTECFMSNLCLKYQKLLTDFFTNPKESVLADSFKY
jgi:hypothetical protein